MCAAQDTTLPNMCVNVDCPAQSCDLAVTDICSYMLMLRIRTKLSQLSFTSNDENKSRVSGTAFVEKFLETFVTVVFSARGIVTLHAQSWNCLLQAIGLTLHLITA